VASTFGGNTSRSVKPAALNSLEIAFITLRVDLNPLKRKAGPNVMIDFPILLFEMVPKTYQGSFFVPTLA